MRLKRGEVPCVGDDDCIICRALKKLRKSWVKAKFKVTSALLQLLRGKIETCGCVAGSVYMALAHLPYEGGHIVLTGAWREELTQELMFIVETWDPLYPDEARTARAALRRLGHRQEVHREPRD